MQDCRHTGCNPVACTCVMFMAVALRPAIAPAQLDCACHACTHLVSHLARAPHPAVATERGAFPLHHSGEPDAAAGRPSLPAEAVRVRHGHVPPGCAGLPGGQQQPLVCRRGGEGSGAGPQAQDWGTWAAGSCTRPPPCKLHMDTLSSGSGSLPWHGVVYSPPTCAAPHPLPSLMHHVPVPHKLCVDVPRGDRNAPAWRWLCRSMRSCPLHPCRCRRCWGCATSWHPTPPPTP
jgi:hypothetical protein